MRNSLSTLVLALVVVLSARDSIAAASPQDTRAEPGARGRPSQTAGAARSQSTERGYVGSDACRSCHVSNHRSWSASYHRTMTQVASSRSIQAPFAGSTPVFEDMRWDLSTHDGEYFVTPFHVPTQETFATRRVVLTTGSHNYQILWLEERDGGGMAQLPLVWHIEEHAWVPRKAMFLLPPAPGTRSEMGRWKVTCIKCHSTAGISEVAPEGQTEVAEFGITCEACHGPGALHVIEREKDPEQKLRTSEPAPDEPAPDPTIINPARLPHDRSTEVCGQCHSIQPFTTDEIRAQWRKNGFAYRPGDELAQTRTLARGRAADNSDAINAYLDDHPGYVQNSFWSDGEVRVSGREYNGLIESACYQRGEMSCLSCHTLHAEGDDRPRREWANDQLLPGARNSAPCLSCHESYEDPARRQAHTHHASGSSGSECLNCHMPFTTYGLTRAIRSHTISSPNVATTLTTGRPNACNQCHLDQSLAWTAEHMEAWYETPVPAMDSDQAIVAASILDALEGDAGRRALAAWSMGWEPAREVAGTGWMLPYLGTLLMDPYDAVRWIAVRSLRSDPRYATFELDFTGGIEDQRNVVRERIVAEWLERGLQAPLERYRALLIAPDGKLDQPRFRSIYARRDRSPVRLAE